MQKRLIRLLSLWLLTGLVAGLAVMSGCGTGNPYPPGSYERGVFFAEKGKNLEAVSSFESFVRRNPTDSLAAEAQFRKAVTYMKMKEYPLAAVEFQILRKDYPTSPRVEEALYQEGMAYLKQVGRIERDISGAYEARAHFRDFLRTYPDSRFRPQVEQAMVEISDLIVTKRLREINVYRQLGRYTAVAATLDNILESEQDSSLLDKVLWERARAAFRLEKEEEGRGFLQQLVQRYPESDYADQARRELGPLSAPADSTGS